MNGLGMKNYVLVVLISVNVVFGQEVIFKGNINVKAKETRIISGLENNGTVLLNVNEGEGSNKFYLISNDGRVIQYYDIISREKFFHVIQLAAIEDYYYVYTYQESYYTSPNGVRQDLNYIQNLKFSKDGSTRPVLTNLTGINPYDKYLVSLNRNDTIFIVGFNEKKNSASVSMVSPDQRVTRKEFNFSDRKEFKRFYRENYFPVKNLQENSFETFLHKNKVYLKGTEIVFISNDDSGNVSRIDNNPKASLDRNAVFITSLNLETGKASVNELKLTYSIKADHNSYLYRDYLIVMGSTRMDFSLSVYSYPSLIEKRKFSQNEIVSVIDWSKLLVSNNQTTSAIELKDNFNILMKKGSPVIGLRGTDTLSFMLGLFDHEGAQLTLGKNYFTGLTSYGLYNYRGDFLYKPRQLPLYFLPSAARPIYERRIYGEILFNIDKLEIVSGVRPNSIYDLLELQTEKIREKSYSMAVFSFENEDYVFIAYISKVDKMGDSYIFIEKYNR